MAGIPVHTLHPGVRTNATNSVCTGVTWPIYGRRQHWGAEGTSYLSPCLQLQSQIPPPLLHGDCSLRFERTSFVSWFMPTSHSTARMRLLACSQGQPVIDLLQKRRDFWLEQVSPGYRLQLTRKRESCAPAPSPPPQSAAFSGFKHWFALERAASSPHRRAGSWCKSFQHQIILRHL